MSGTAATSGASFLIALAAVGTMATTCPPTPVDPGVELLASTVLVTGGNTNPDGLTPAMAQQLGGDPWYPATHANRLLPVGVFGQGHFDTQNNPASPYYGWDLNLVSWPAQIGLRILGQSSYEQSQNQGVANVDHALKSALPTLGTGESVVAFGYSSGSNVMVREMRSLMTESGGAPATEQLAFFLMGNPNRPNGGILQRFPGLHIPVLDIRTDGSTPVDTPYVTTDIAWEYDAAGDFPLHPTNLLAVLNSVWSGSYLHGDYYQADINGPRAWPDVTVGNITYITLEPPHLPLLMPLYYLGFPTALLDLVEPALTVMIDWGYDRSISPGTPTRARLMPTTNPITAAADLVNAVRAGVHSFRQDLGGATAVRPTRAARPELSRLAGVAGSTPATRPALTAFSASTERPAFRLAGKTRIGALSGTGRTPVRPGRQWSPER